MLNPHVHIPYERLNEHAGFLLKNKLNLEVYFNSNALDDFSIDELLAIINGLGYIPEFSIHAPFMDLSPGAVDSRVREVTIARFEHILEISKILKPKTIVFHSGYEKWKYALRTDIWLEKSLLTWLPINEKAKKLGVKIAIENIFEDEPLNLRLLIEHMDSENFGICFDTGHFNLFSKKNLKEWMDEIGQYIIELHLHDNDRSSDQHLPIGEGTFIFEGFLDQFQESNCIFTIESHSPESVLKSIENLKGFIKS